ncbi:LacI family DNA-binding transcriptional regulator [Gordonia sp. NB41Y]|uniref:LacI family DNA-binding transcriptional regulator n=1 Tax=Gordonia sp. NB41Y TaxID=875808 RepID=UPI00034C67BF|nr:LacI family DNA-binding transcriptional regulator [Gordonia sp. NB41Y]WLP92926.1 LacI family DNA-binding transcriptional regulator [Gordonia sp. NB41Y]
MNERQRVTLKTVADAAGVHASTVSRVLRRGTGRTGRPSDSDLRIVQIASDLGYVPNPNAASLTTRRSSAFGVLVPQLTDVVLSCVYDNIESTANAAGYDAFVANTHDDPKVQARRRQLLIGRSVDGLIIGDARLDDPTLPKLAGDGTVSVLVNRRYPGLLSVTCDDRRGGRLAAEHLLELGHTDVGVVTGPLWSSTGADRLDGFRETYAERGITIPDDAVAPVGFGVDDGVRGTLQILAQHPQITALFVANDDAAIGAIGALRDSGLRPGTDVSLLGYNDIPAARNLMLPLTTIRSPYPAMGRHACEVLLAAMNGLPVSSLVLQPELVVRGTTSHPHHRPTSR